jgi:hypothetical protein
MTMLQCFPHLVEWNKLPPLSSACSSLISSAAAAAASSPLSASMVALAATSPNSFSFSVEEHQEFPSNQLQKFTSFSFKCFFSQEF